MFDCVKIWSEFGAVELNELTLSSITNQNRNVFILNQKITVAKGRLIN